MCIVYGKWGGVLFSARLCVLCTVTSLLCTISGPAPSTIYRSPRTESYTRYFVNVLYNHIYNSYACVHQTTLHHRHHHHHHHYLLLLCNNKAKNRQFRLAMATPFIGTNGFSRRLRGVHTSTVFSILLSTAKLLAAQNAILLLGNTYHLLSMTTSL